MANGKNGNGANSGTVEKTYRELVEAKTALHQLMRSSPEVFEKLGELADDFNQKLEAHRAALKANKAESPLFNMTIPKAFVCKDIELARRTLGESFAEYVETEYKFKTQAIRNALQSGTRPGMEMVFEEVEQSPRHIGPKPIDLSALREGK